MIVFIVWLAFIFIESANKKLKLARRYHKIGEKLYKKGDIESSKLYYEAANIYRERAYKRLEE